MATTPLTPPRVRYVTAHEGSVPNISLAEAKPAPTDNLLREASEQKLLRAEQAAWKSTEESFAPLLGSPVRKLRARDTQLTSAQRQLTKMDTASYLVTQTEPKKVYRLGNSQDFGSFSKIANYVDEAGNTGKMRILHLTPQNKEHPAHRVSVVSAEGLSLELAAQRKAGSVLANAPLYSLVRTEGRHRPSYKLFAPMPDLGLDAYYFANVLNNEAHGPDELAAGLRYFMQQINAPLLALHADKRQGGRRNPLQGPMVHRDIKPENVMVNAQGEIHLIDYGLAAPISQVDGVVGTQGYIDPEYLLQGAGRQDPHVEPKLDIWSLGATALVTFFWQDMAYTAPQQLIQGKPHEVAARQDHILHAFLLQEYWQTQATGQPMAPRLERALGDLAFEAGHAKLRPRYKYEARALDRLQHSISAVDPELAALFMQHIFRVDADARYDANKLHLNMNLLTPIYGSAQEDLLAGKALFARAYVAAQKIRGANIGGDNAQAPTARGPSIRTLEALPATPVPTPSPAAQALFASLQRKAVPKG